MGVLARLVMEARAAAGIPEVKRVTPAPRIPPVAVEKKERPRVKREHRHSDCGCGH